ncbi:MAG: hypothetical protein K8R77_14545 [Anaerolineaceae bacterium]|nr:hypothetical protein [Anaerolineaceae bacterium]
MSPCKCSDPYALLILLYGPERGKAAGEILRQLLPEPAAPATGDLNESSMILPTASGLGQQSIMMKDIELNHTGLDHPWFQGFLQGDPAYDDFYLCPPADADLSGVFRPVGTPLRSRIEDKTVWTTFSPDQPDLNYQNPAVMLKVIDTLLTALRTGIRLLRLQHIAYLWKEAGTSCLHLPQDLLILSLIRAALQIAAPDVRLVVKVGSPWEQRPAYFGNGLNAAHLIETNELPLLLLDAFARQKSDVLQTWASGLALPTLDITFFHCLSWPDAAAGRLAANFLNQSQLDALQTALASTPSENKPPSFLAALKQSGKKLTPELELRRSLAAHAILLALTGLPAVEAESLAALDQDLRELLRARAASPAFSPYGAQMSVNSGSACLGLLRIAPDGTNLALCVTNLSAETQEISMNAASLGFTGEWRDLLTGDVMDLNGKEWRRLEGYQSRWWVAK